MGKTSTSEEHITNLERMRSYDTRDLADLLCTVMDNSVGCDACPFTKLCRHGSIGTLTWLLRSETDPEDAAAALELENKARILGTGLPARKEAAYV